MPEIIDCAGIVEQSGVEFIDEKQKTSNPWNVFVVFVGAGCSFPMIVFGWLPISFGLDASSAMISMCLGIALATIIVLPLTLLGPQTGTNMTVASGAFFGIRGRFIGSLIALVTAVVYAAITVWTCGDAITASAHRLTGAPINDLTRAGAYALVTMVMVPVAIYGHATIISTQRIVAPLVALIFITGVFAFSGTFDGARQAGEYELGGYWQSWFLSFVIGFAGPFSYVPVIGDYTRRVSLKRYSRAGIVSVSGLGLFFANAVPPVFGIMFAASLLDGAPSFVDGLVQQAPLWYLAPLMLAAILGGMSQGVLNLYASGLDLEGLFPSLSRVHTTAITSFVAVVLLYGGVFLLDAAEAIAGSALLINAVGAPWAAVLILGALKNSETGYDEVDLQRFATGQKGGKYWYWLGWNPQAVSAWAVGSLFGALTIQTPGYFGPFANIAQGVDVSAVGSVAVTSLVSMAISAILPLRHPRKK